MYDSKESFKKIMKDELPVILPFEADIVFREVTRSTGEVYEAMTVTSKEAQMGVNLRLDFMMERYEKEPKSMMLSLIKDEVIEKINQMRLFMADCG